MTDTTTSPCCQAGLTTGTYDFRTHHICCLSCYKRVGVEDFDNPDDAMAHVYGRCGTPGFNEHSETPVTCARHEGHDGAHRDRHGYHYGQWA